MIIFAESLLKNKIFYESQGENQEILFDYQFFA
jgi:hypothetical protein